LSFSSLFFLIIFKIYVY